MLYSFILLLQIWQFIPSFLTVNTFTKHNYQKLQTVQFVHMGQRGNIWYQRVHAGTTTAEVMIYDR